MSKKEEYVEKIREIDGLKNAILCQITLSKKDKSAEFFLVTDKAYTKDDEKRVAEISQQFLPSGTTAKVKIVKRVPDEDGLKKKIHEYITLKFPAAGAFLDEKSIHVEMLQSGAQFVVEVASGEQSLFNSGKILDDVSAYLQSGYCGSFYGNVRIVDKKEVVLSDLEEIPETEEEETLQTRYFPICDFVKLDGADKIPTHAVYIGDYLMQEGVFAVCGKITYIEEREYIKHNEKTGEDVQKSRFSITLNDGSDALRTTYFPKKATVEKVRELKVGDSVVIIGENEEYNGSRSFKAGKINYGNAPEGFVPETRKGKSVPRFYHTVFPEPYVDYTQAGFFDTFDKPSDLTDNVFVVFDLETTGLNNNPAMGRMDKIIEIGAVKIAGGEIVEKFSSFVACDEKLSGEIINLTGITDEMLVGAPTIEKVIADFYKFADGAFLVGHNVTFDYRFVHYYGEKNGYSFNHKQYDTLHLAQELLRGIIPNYKLNSVADYYGFSFNHHRAFDDACVTAKVFIELIKKRGKLPF